MSNTHKIHSQASADGTPSIFRPAGGFTGLPRPEGSWPGSVAGRAGKGRVKAGGLGAFTPVQRQQEPQAGVGPTGPLFHPHQAWLVWL